MRQHGFVHVDGYDLFVVSASTRPATRYDMVTCFEVIGPVLEPKALVADLAICRASQGAVLIPTLLCSPQVIDFGLQNWHYCVPRNGFISFMTAPALMHCAAQVGLRAHSFSEGAHVLFDPLVIPDWLAPVLPKQATGGQ